MVPEKTPRLGALCYGDAQVACEVVGAVRWDIASIANTHRRHEAVNWRYIKPAVTGTRTPLLSFC